VSTDKQSLEFIDTPIDSLTAASLNQRFAYLTHSTTSTSVTSLHRNSNLARRLHEDEILYADL